MEKRLTEEQCWELFQCLFPNGLEDPALVQTLAPEGWENSPLALIYHPTVEQLSEETLRLRDNLRRLRGTAAGEEEPRISLDTFRREMPVEAPKLPAECADLMGCCLWDIFSDNHEAHTADALVDLGTFRAAAGLTRMCGVDWAIPKQDSLGAAITSNSTWGPRWSGIAQI